MPIDVCLATEGDAEEGWQEHIRYTIHNASEGRLVRWYSAWKNGGNPCVEINQPLKYHDEAEWVEAKKAAQALLDLTE
jgi:hypothetical protein